MWKELSKQMITPEAAKALETYKAGAGFNGNNQTEDDYYRSLAGGSTSSMSPTKPVEIDPHSVYQKLAKDLEVPPPSAEGLSGYEHYDPELTMAHHKKFKQFEHMGDKLDNLEYMIEQHKEAQKKDPNYVLMPDYYKLVRQHDDIEDKLTNDPDFERYQEVLHKKYGGPTPPRYE